MAAGKKISDKVIDEFSSRADWNMQIDAEARIGARALAHKFLENAATRCAEFAGSAKRKTYTLLDVVNSVVAVFHDEFGADADAGEFVSRAFGVDGIPAKVVYAKEDLPEEPNMHVPGTTKSGEKRNLINSLNALRPNEVKLLFKTTQNAPTVANVFAQRAADEYAVRLFVAAGERAIADKKKRIAYKHLLKGKGDEPAPASMEVDEDEDVGGSPPALPAVPDGLSVLPAPPDGASVLPAPVVGGVKKARKVPTPKVKGAKKAGKTKGKMAKALPVKIKVGGDGFEDPFADDYNE